MAQYYHKTFI